MKQKLNRYGYYEIRLSKNNKFENFMVGRLVAEHFIPNPNLKPKVMHIGDPKDNSVTNLAWAYESEIKHNTYTKGARKGHPTYAKISYNGKKYYRYQDIAKDLGINYKTFWNRMDRGWGLWESLEVPVAKRGKKL